MKLNLWGKMAVDKSVWIKACFHLEIWYGKFVGVRNPKVSLIRLKNKPVLIRYSIFQLLGTCDQTSTEKYMWPEK